MKRSVFMVLALAFVLFFVSAVNLSAQILLNEVSVNPALTDGPCEYFELRGTPGAVVENIHFVSLEGDSGSTPGVATGVVTFGSPGPAIGANGLLVVVGTQPCGSRTYPAATTVLTTTFLDNSSGALQNGTNSFLLISSATAITPGTDYDTDNNGTLESLPAGATIIDGVAWTDGGAGDIAYGVTLTSVGGTTGAATRFRNDPTPNSFAAWYNGGLVDDGSGNASVTYSTTIRSTNFPIGGMLTPGNVNAPIPVTKVYTAYLNGSNEVPPNSSTAQGFGRLFLNEAETQITVSTYYNNLTSGITAAHIHGPSAVGGNANVLFDLTPTPGPTSGSVQDRVFAVTAAQVADLKAGLWYINVHNSSFPNGEIRGQLLPARPPIDIEADGRTDYVVLRDSNGASAEGFIDWYISLSSNYAMHKVTWGIYNPDTEDLAPADYDGDGKTDIAVWRRSVPFGNFYIILSSNFTLNSVELGFPTDDPVPGDYNGDGKADVAVVRQEVGGFTGWYYRPSFGAGYQAIALNGSGARAGGDYDGDGIYDPAVFEDNVATPRFVILMSGGGGTVTIELGNLDDLVAPGDYDGDGKTDPAVIRNVGGFWQWTYRPSAGGPDVTDTWGIAPTDMPTPGDYNGDGKFDYAIWRPNAQGEFFVMTPVTRLIFTRQWGLAGDFPLAYGTNVSND